MQERLVFLIAAPRSGSTLLARMLGAHSGLFAPAEPHLLTPLAHLGYFASVDEAPYDPIITRGAARELVAALPGGEGDYLDALRAYSDAVYARLLQPSGRQLLLDKTPAYALVLDFLTRLYPKARYVVLTRSPIAVWSSYVESFFDGDHEVAHQHNPLLERYVPAIARLLRDAPVPLCPVRYEQLVEEPERELGRICAFLGIGFEPGMVEYGSQPGGAQTAARGLGDPVNVARNTRPRAEMRDAWREALAGQPAKVEQAHRILASLGDPDLASWGFDREALAAELDAVPGDGGPPRRRRLSRHALERRLLVRLRRNIHHNALGRAVKRVRFLCDVLLR